MDYFIYNVRVHLLYYIGSIQIIGTVSPSPSDPFHQVLISLKLNSGTHRDWASGLSCIIRGSEVGLELDGGSIQVINLSEIISLEGGDDACELRSILIFMFNII